MLIKFFKSSYLIQYFFLVLLTAAIWIPGFLANQGLPVEPNLITPLYNLALYVLKMFDAASPAAALVIVVISAFTLNNILVFHELTPKNNLLPAFLFIVFMAATRIR
jgi:putative flippase GtrA